MGTQLSFNSGQLSEMMKYRVDTDKRTMGAEELENVIVDQEGMAFKRPGTEFIDTEIAEYGIQIIVTPEVLGDYPTLRTTTDQADPGLTHTLAISNVTELQAMNDNKTGNYYLTGNIDASATSTWNAGAGFVPIGQSGVASGFKGTFDGCGYTISDLYINRNSNGQALFGWVYPEAKIANVTMANIDISGGSSYVGALVGFMLQSDVGDILIQNCHSSGTIAPSGGGVMGYYGGLIGYAARQSGHSAGTAYIYDCSSTCTLDMSTATSGSYRGGFVGWLIQTTVSNCFATGSLTGGDGGDEQIGGFVGATFQSSYSFCYATGSVEGAFEQCGGFVGDVGADTSFNSCSATGNSSGAVGGTAVGGFAGSVVSAGDAITFADCYAWGDAVSGGTVSGGFVGSSPTNNTTYDNCYSIGIPSGTAELGGIAGAMHASTKATNIYWDTETSGLATTDENVGTGHTTTWMKTKSNLTDAGWDMDTIWYQAYTAIVYGDLGGGGGNVRLIPFEFRTNDAYVIEMGHECLSFFRTTQ